MKTNQDTFQFSARKSVIQKFNNGSTEHAILKSLCQDEYDKVAINNKTWNGNSEWNTVRQSLLDFSQPCDEMLRFCSFGHETLQCMSIFDTILTDGGAYFSKIKVFHKCTKPIDKYMGFTSITSLNCRGLLFIQRAGTRISVPKSIKVN